MMTKQTAEVRERPGIPDRHYDPKQRERHETALRLLAPALEQDDASDTTMYLVMERLQKFYPEMSATDVEALFMSALRSLKNKGMAHRSAAAN